MGETRKPGLEELPPGSLTPETVLGFLDDRLEAHCLDGYPDVIASLAQLARNPDGSGVEFDSSGARLAGCLGVAASVARQRLGSPGDNDRALAVATSGANRVLRES